jgi:uncharacterized protein
MKLETYPISAPAISGYGPGWIAIDGRRFDASVVVRSAGEITPWNCARFSDLTEEHFAVLGQGRPDVVIFGSGARMRFPAAAWLRALARQHIGVEAMDTAAACRTYNILAGEGRHVVAAVLIECGQPPLPEAGRT